MGAPIQRLWHYISRWPVLNVFQGGTSIPEQPGAPDPASLDRIPVAFKECEGVCEPTAGQIEARERERTERFKGDQLLPVMGIGGGSPSPPS